MRKVELKTRLSAGNGGNAAELAVALRTGAGVDRRSRMIRRRSS